MWVELLWLIENVVWLRTPTVRVLPARTSSQWARAADAFRNALRLDPKHARAHFNLGATLAGQGELLEAYKEFLRALAAKPGYAMAEAGIAQVKPILQAKGLL